MTQFLTLPAALARAKERCQGKATAADDGFLSELLEMSAGTVAGVTHFRPYYVSARFLEQKQSAQSISEADGAKFTGLAKPIASLMQVQAAYDSAYALEIPPGFEAVQEGPQRLRSRSVNYQLRP